ncbi:MAG: putative oxidoreductase C-terminal domain-containing protein [Woeseiaceae bacterium]
MGDLVRRAVLLGAVLFSFTAMRGAAAGETAPMHRLITLDPGHFHAALVQKSMYPNVDALVHVYAPDGPDVDLHLARIEAFNTRADAPTHWESVVYRGDDFLEKMVADRAGDIVVISGNNARKTDYILSSIEAGFNVYADKPMAITPAEFGTLEQAAAIATAHHLLLLDIMTERYEITTVLQRAISRIPAVYGEQLAGSADEPALVQASVHHFHKTVAGRSLTRPAWFFDEAQEGGGLVDVMTHLVDLVQWECFPGETIDYKRDIELGSSSRWATPLTHEQFRDVTGLDALPDFLTRNVRDGVLQVFANGEIGYRIRGIYARTRAEWAWEAPGGGGDTHYSEMRGSRAKLVIRQGEAQGDVPELYLEPNAPGAFDLDALEAALAPVLAKYPGVGIRPAGDGFRVDIPESYRVGHEAHFAQVTEAYLRYLDEGGLPEEELPNLLAKYYVTTGALASATTR